MIQWELADPADREETLQDATRFIETDVLPYFERFEDVDALLADLSVSAIPALDLVPSVEFSYRFGGRAHAQATLDRFLRERPDLHAAIASESASPPAWTRPIGFAQQTVFLRHHFQLT